MTLSLWELALVSPEAYEDVEIAAAYRGLHEGLASFRGELPSFWGQIEECGALLNRPSALPNLEPRDRAFLISQYAQLTELVGELELRRVPLHGDAHRGNLLSTATGALWADFESVCLGPVEWDLTCLPDGTEAAFSDVNPSLLAVLSDLRSLCVAGWCSVDSDTGPEVREAAEHHLERLRARARRQGQEACR